jgi:hypothetical protein
MCVCVWGMGVTCEDLIEVSPLSAAHLDPLVAGVGVIDVAEECCEDTQIDRDRGGKDRHDRDLWG